MSKLELKLLAQNDFVAIRDLYCANYDYTNYIQGETIEYVPNINENRDVYIKVKTFGNKEIECRVYNRNNNVKIRRRDYSKYPIKEDDHIFSFDYRTGRSTVSCIHRDVFVGNDTEYPKVTKYSKATFEWDGSLCDYEDEVKKLDNNKRKKY